MPGLVWPGESQRYKIDQNVLKEASGVVQSRRDAGLLWAHNDSGDWSTLYAISTQGHFRGRVDILGADALDWEDIAAFEIDGEPWLLIADVGDNFGFRAQVSLYLLPEPDIQKLKDGFTLDADVAHRIDFQFEDGPRDVEAVAVDAIESKIYLLSKRDKPPVLYVLPLRPEANQKQPQNAKPTTEIKTLPGVREQDLLADPNFGKFSNQPTAMDISADGQRWMITTYKAGLIYTREPGQDVAQMFSQQPKRITLPKLPQLEAGALSPDGRMGYFISERQPAELVIKSVE